MWSSITIENFKSMNIKNVIIALIISLFAISCATIRPGEVGVKQKLGKLGDKVYQPGVVGVNPFVTTMVRIPTRTVNLEVNLNLPSKEGLNVSSNISILYHIEAEKAIEILNNVGQQYESVLILSVFRSAAADICSEFFAKDMHSGNRNEIEKQILERMNSYLAHRGFTIESVLMKSINLPSGLYSAIEDKLEAEQDAQRMQFVLEREKLEAQRRRIEAEGIKDAQLILKDGLSEQIIKWKSLEVLDNLAGSENSKLIITDGKTPVLINSEQE